MSQSYSQRGVNTLYRTFERDCDGCSLRFRSIFVIAVELRWEDQITSICCALAQCKVVGHELFHRGQQEQLLLLGVLDPLFFRNMKAASEGNVFGNRSQTVRLVLRSDYHCGGVSVQHFRLQQNVIPKTEPADQIAVFQESDTSVELGPKIVVLRN